MKIVVTLTILLFIVSTLLIINLSISSAPDVLAIGGLQKGQSVFSLSSNTEDPPSAMEKDVQERLDHLRSVGDGPAREPEEAWRDWLQPRPVREGTREAWVWMAYDEGYLMGVLVAMEALRIVGTSREYLLLIPQDVADKDSQVDVKDYLKRFPDRTEAAAGVNTKTFTFRQLIEVEWGATVRIVVPIESREAGAQSFWKYTWTKFLVWNQTEFRKAVFMDADSIVYQPMDEVFAYEELGAVPDHFSANDGKCDCFHVALLVTEPSTATFDRLMQFANDRVGKKIMYNGDLGILNEFFAHRWTRVPNVYSYMQYYVQPADKVPAGVKMITFNGKKPWYIPAREVRRSHSWWFTVYLQLLERGVVLPSYRGVDAVAQECLKKYPLKKGQRT